MEVDLPAPVVPERVPIQTSVDAAMDSGDVGNTSLVAAATASVAEKTSTSVGTLEASAAAQREGGKEQRGQEEEELVDKFCDPTCPVVVQFNEVTMAAYKIRGGIERTPCSVSACVIQ